MIKISVKEKKTKEKDYISEIQDMIENQFGWTIKKSEIEGCQLEKIALLHSNLSKQKDIEFEFRVQEPIDAFGHAPHVARQSFLKSNNTMQAATPSWTGKYRIKGQEYWVKKAVQAVLLKEWGSCQLEME